MLNVLLFILFCRHAFTTYLFYYTLFLFDWVVSFQVISYHTSDKFREQKFIFSSNLNRWKKWNKHQMIYGSKRIIFIQIDWLVLPKDLMVNRIICDSIIDHLPKNYTVKSHSLHRIVT